MEPLTRLKDDIQKIIDDYQDGLGGPISQTIFLTKMFGLNDAIKAGAYDVGPDLLDNVDKAFDRMLTFEALDEFAMKTIKTSGTIKIVEHDADDPRDTGWVDIDGEITGSFELPLEVCSAIKHEDEDIHYIHLGPDSLTIYDFICDGPVQDAILGKCDIAGPVENYDIDIKVTGVSKKGDNALVEFRVKVL